MTAKEPEIWPLSGWTDGFDDVAQPPCVVEPPPSIDDYGPRLQDVVMLRRSCLTYKEIGKKLGISPSTVKGHLIKAHLKGEPKIGAAPRTRGLP